MKKTLLSILSCMAMMTSMVAQEYVNFGNGVMIPAKDIKSIKPIYRTHPRSLSLLIENEASASLYAQALKVTGIMDSLKCYDDASYKWNNDQDRIDSCTWTNDQLCSFTTNEYDNVAYPEKRIFNHTVFVVSDEVLNAKYGITKVLGKGDQASLEHKAHELYDSMYPEDKNIDDLTDRRNALNRFISYHVLNFYGDYYTLTAQDNAKLANNFNRKIYDICDWYETMMPHSMIKFSFPAITQPGLYINRRGVQNNKDERGVFVPGTRVMKTSDNNAVNGIFHHIEDIIAYDQTTQKLVFDDNIRIECTTLSPDFMTKLTDGETARGRSCANNVKYGVGNQAAAAINNSNHCIGFKPGFVRNIQFDGNTHLHVSNRTLNYWSYQGDEVTIKGKYNVEVKLPPVPAGTYEVRLFLCTGFSSRGIVSTFIDNAFTGMTDLRPAGELLFGNKSDQHLGDAESANDFDRHCHNLGWMKGPNCYASGTKDSFSGTTFRNQGNTVRLVIGRFTTDGLSDHTLKLIQEMEAGGLLDFDFIELVPSTVYDDDNYLEPKK